ncbi:hypothetical protein BDV96DRAFT_563871 [Lophiotrema nucula]|uniref:Peptidase S9 prolyl oligopeptidase catalytic domain-containing protein n=1 Tax=Lophiotrema nucula TaxID=690887 RepID=A0A6A5ZQI3_9PLEO|nr:hypothetical protein BDV96DRAFT_563871 [Lophiotrema nucula]
MALGLLTPLLLWYILGCSFPGATRAHVMTARREDYPLAFSTSWQVLGPFQIGTREATWGADPLEYLGGFRDLQYDQDAQFRSSLPVNGTAKWSIAQAKQTTSTPTSANASLTISYSNVDWAFLKIVYGWAAVQYQAWARGEITVLGNETQHVILYTDWILEFWIDDAHYFGGDFFTFRKAPPVLHLEPGTHRIDLRLVRDVRALGGINEPTIDVLLELQQTTGTLELAKPGVLMSDVVDGKLASPVGSVALRNAGQDDIEIVEIRSSNVRHPLSFIKAEEDHLVLGQDPQSLTASQSSDSTSSNASGVVLVAGQTRPVAFNVSLPSHNASSLTYVVVYKSVKSKGEILSFFVTQNLTKLSIYEPHKITYLHPGGMVSYAMLRPPAKNATCEPGGDTTLPVLLGLHGAGLEADNGKVAHALDPVADLCAWVLFPTGVTPWSGDDWHNWGFTDVEAAVNSIPGWITSAGWRGPDVDVNRWIISGHSNGGQGTWYALTHRPDHIVAAAPVSGYASIQKYVPYELWQPADPRRTAVISGSLNSYRHEMLMENAQGIPIVQQHGEIDDNVPAYNSRLLSQMLFQAGTNSSYYELPGKNHWFDTVMTTDDLKEFYRTQTSSTEAIPRRLQSFSFVVADPGDMGPKGGIRVTHLEDPGQYGRVHVQSHTIRTSNVMSLELDTKIWVKSSMSIDGESFDVSQASGDERAFALSKEGGLWKVGALSLSESDILTRNGRQLGAMTAVLRTHGPFTIRHQGPKTAHIALQVSRNLHQYFSAASNIVVTGSNGSVPESESGNIITVAIGEVPSNVHPNFPIQAGATGVSIRDNKGRSQTFMDDVGAAFLRPLAGEKLELVLWGVNGESLSQAARLLPTLTGVGQPDIIILGRTARWRGVEGALALGFFDHSWNVTPSSVVW